MTDEQTVSQYQNQNKNQLYLLYTFLTPFPGETYVTSHTN